MRVGICTWVFGTLDLDRVAERLGQTDCGHGSLLGSGLLQRGTILTDAVFW